MASHAPLEQGSRAEVAIPNDALGLAPSPADEGAGATASLEDTAWPHGVPEEVAGKPEVLGELKVRWPSGVIVAELHREGSETSSAIKHRLQSVEGFAEVSQMKLLAGGRVLGDDEPVEAGVHELTLVYLQGQPQPGHYCASKKSGYTDHSYSLTLSEDGGLRGSWTRGSWFSRGRDPYGYPDLIRFESRFEGRGTWCYADSLVLSWESGETTPAEWEPSSNSIAWQGAKLELSRGFRESQFYKRSTPL